MITSYIQIFSVITFTKLRKLLQIGKYGFILTIIA